MTPQAIPHDTWAWFLDRFSGTHRGEQATIDIFGPCIGTGTLAIDVALVGISILRRASGACVAIAVTDPEGVGLTYHTATPLAVTFEAGANGDRTLVGITADDGTTTFLQCQGTLAMS